VRHDLAEVVPDAHGVALRDRTRPRVVRMERERLLAGQELAQVFGVKINSITVPA
jgi:hypothetical protein